MSDYSTVRPNPNSHEDDYKAFFGGKAIQWEQRGAFQLKFLMSQGMAPGHSLADVGCGPLRAGHFLIRYLDPGKYCGVDYNANFIAVAKNTIAADEHLRSKSPTLDVVRNFDLEPLAREFDFILLFSVLNHCSDQEKALFFQNLPRIMHADTKVLISHAAWLSPNDVPSGMIASMTTALSGDLDPSKWGWNAKESLLPIVELRRCCNNA